MRQNRRQLLILAAALASVLMSGYEAGADDGMAAALALFQKKNYNATVYLSTALVAETVTGGLAVVE